MPAPSTPEAQNLHREVLALIEQEAMQQAEISASRIRQQGPEVSVHAGSAAGQPANQGRTPIRERILDTRGQAPNGETPVDSFPLGARSANPAGTARTRAITHACRPSTAVGHHAGNHAHAAVPPAGPPRHHRRVRIDVGNRETKKNPQKPFS
jgi:hypothetical protein